LNASISANRAGMIGSMLIPIMPSASGNHGQGARSRNTIVRSASADRSSVCAISVCPNASRLPQRLMLATQSRASTASPSWNRNPSRKRRRRSRPSRSTAAPSTICGCTAKLLSWP